MYFIKMPFHRFFVILFKKDDRFGWLNRLFVETYKNNNLSSQPFNRRCKMARILPIRLKIQSLFCINVYFCLVPSQPLRIQAQNKVVGAESRLHAFVHNENKKYNCQRLHKSQNKTHLHYLITKQQNYC